MNITRSNNTRARTKKSDGRIGGKNKRFRRRRPINTIGRAIDRRVGVYQAAGGQALRDLNRLRQFINAEIHYLDTVQTAVNITSTTTFVLLNGMQTGDTSITRTGQSIKMDGLDFRWYVTGNVTAVQVAFRLLVVVDKQPNNAIFAIGSLLNTATVVSPYTVGGQSRFVVLYDQTYSLTTAGPLAANACVRIAANQHVEYNTANAGDITDINTNSLYLLMISDQAVNVPIMYGYLRLWFIDN